MTADVAGCAPGPCGPPADRAGPSSSLTAVPDRRAISSGQDAGTDLTHVKSRRVSGEGGARSLPRFGRVASESKQTDCIAIYADPAAGSPRRADGLLRRRPVCFAS